MIRNITAVLLFLTFHVVISAQSIFLGIRSVYDNDLTEWEIFLVNEREEEETAFLSLQWPLRYNWEEWDYEMPDHGGRIKTKWRGNNELVEIRTRWRNDVNEWVISHRGRQVVVKTQYHNDANTWIAEDDEGSFAVFTEYFDDPRDWIIEDDLWEASDLQKLGIVFIALYQSIPKR